ncbi:hypothetical protein ACVIWU_004490 [Bradyrhizobium sp. USDA 4509]
MVRDQIHNAAGFPTAVPGSENDSVVRGPIPGIMVPRIGDEADLLPARAADRLRDLRQQSDDAHTLMMAAFEESQGLRLEIEGDRNRLRRLRGPRGSDGFNLDEDDPRVVIEQTKIDKKTAELKRRTELSELRGGRLNVLTTLVGNAEAWIRSVRSGTAIVMHEPVDIGVKKGESILAAIERIQRRGRELRADLARVAAAPHPSTIRREAMVREVEAWAEQGRPNAAGSIEHGESIDWPLAHHQFEIFNAGPGAIVFGQLIDIRNFMAWWDKDGMIKRLGAEIDAVSDDDAALSDEERARTSAEISADLLAVQRCEAELVWRGIADGAAIMHRPDIDPMALLGVTLASAPPPIARDDEGQAGLIRHLGP